MPCAHTRWLSRRARALFCVGWLWLGACAQTDVIAREAIDLCADFGVCDGPNSCAATSCAELQSSPAACEDQAARVTAGDGCAPERPSSSVSRFALCACTDFVSTHALVTESWDSQSSTTQPESGASVAVNGGFTTHGSLDLQGALLVSESFSAGGDAANGARAGVLEHAQLPCLCEASSFLDIEALVQARAQDNENAALGWSPASLDGFAFSDSAAALELGCGRYVLDAIHGSGALRFHVSGHAELFVVGDIALDGDFNVELDPQSSLDLFVAGNLRVSGTLALGAAENAGAVRVYVGGSGTIDLAQEALLAGALYAPRAELVSRGRFEAFGAVFVRRAAPGDDLVIHYDLAAREPVSCTAQP